MQLFMFKSKIHRARVTDSNLHYEGSITVDGALLELTAISPYEEEELAVWQPVVLHVDEHNRPQLNR